MATPRRRSPTSKPSAHTICWLGLVSILAGCHVDADEFNRSMVLDKPWQPDASAPEGSSPPETRLYQLLYAGEHGDSAHALGQRVRMAAWLRTVALSDAQLTQLVELGIKVQNGAQADRDARAELAARELDALAPIYGRLEAALATPETSIEALETLAVELAEARAALYGDAAPQQAHRQRIGVLIDDISAWLTGLSRAQRLQINHCRFVLAEHAAPLTNPGSYASLVGMNWDRGDFSALQTGTEASDDGPLDIGGLWALEHLRAPPSGYMVHSARAGMLLLALLDPAFLPTANAALVARGLPVPPSTDRASTEDRSPPSEAVSSEVP